MNRPAALLASASMIAAMMATPASAIKLASKEVFIPSATQGVRVNAYAFYSEADGVRMIGHHSEQTVSDKADVAYVRISEDNGKTWTGNRRVVTNRPVEGGTFREGVHPGFVDPDKKILLQFILRGVFPNDDPLEGMRQWTLHYRLSRIDVNGEPILHFQGPVIQTGESFTTASPLPGVAIGKNSPMIGDLTCHPIKTRQGEILQPIQITPVGPDGDYYNPGGGYTYHDSAVLIGVWNDRDQLNWTLSEKVVGDPARSTRGMLEPSLAEADDGRILMVMRGSNDRKPEVPGYRWSAISDDGGRTWSEPEPWQYTDGQAFHSPSSCSQLLKHSSGRIFWIGNISSENPNGNLPRYPLVIGEVDGQSLLLKKETLCPIDDRRPGDWERLAISNFFAHEDRESKEIVVYAAPLFRKTPTPGPDGKNPPLDWTADSHRYRLRVD